MIKKARILVIGAGKGGAACIDLLFRSPSVDLVGVVDTDQEAPGIALAKELGIPTADDYHGFFEKGEVDEILNLTGSETVQEELIKVKPAGSEVIGGHSARLMWGLIEERRVTGKALAESEKKFELLFRGAAEGILVAEIETKKIKYANPAVCRMLGYTEEELKCLGVADIHPPESNERVFNEFEAQARGEKTLAKEIPCLRKDGNIIYANINTTCIFIDGERCNVGFFSDITDCKKVEEALRKSEQKWHSLIKNAPNMIILADNEGTIQFINRTVSGYGTEEVVGTKLFDYVEREYHGTMREQLDRVFQHGLSGYYQIQGKGAGGSLAWYEAHLGPIIDHEEITSAILMVTDITKRKDSERERDEHKELLDKTNSELKWKIEELEAALNHIKRLEGLIPICMQCKKMRREGGDPKDPDAWISMEKYIGEKTTASFTHGLCPECLKKMYGDIEKGK